MNGEFFNSEELDCEGSKGKSEQDKLEQVQTPRKETVLPYRSISKVAVRDAVKSCASGSIPYRARSCEVVTRVAVVLINGACMHYVGQVGTGIVQFESILAL